MTEVRGASAERRPGQQQRTPERRRKSGWRHHWTMATTMMDNDDDGHLDCGLENVTVHPDDAGYLHDAGEWWPGQ